MSNLKIVRQIENPLFKRQEVEVNFESNVPPKMQEAEELLAKEFSTNAENVKIKKISGSFGSRVFKITANIYSLKEDKDKTEIKKKEKKA